MNSYRPRNTRLRPNQVPSIYRKSNNSESTFTSSTDTEMKRMQNSRYTNAEDTRKENIRNPNTKRKLQMTCSVKQITCCLCLIITLALLGSVAIGSILAILLPHKTTLSTSTTTATTATSTRWRRYAHFHCNRNFDGINLCLFIIIHHQRRLLQLHQQVLRPVQVQHRALRVLVRLHQQVLPVVRVQHQALQLQVQLHRQALQLPVRARRQVLRALVQLHRQVPQLVRLRRRAPQPRQAHRQVLRRAQVQHQRQHRHQALQLLHQQQRVSVVLYTPSCASVTNPPGEILDLLSKSASVTYTHYTYNFTATDSSSTLSFIANGDSGGKGGFYWLLDDVFVNDLNTSTNVLTNGDFETGDLSGWSQYCNNDGNCKNTGYYAHTTTNSCRSGNYCVYDSCGNYDYLYQSFSTVIGNYYFISYYLRCGAVGGGSEIYVTLT
ncbi:unnamed protein product [Adineta ricciae]|uniref:Uncharacterized protein n=1 Tax=Adineta ricciae TaxID=249248 RepID=A0A814KF20_ADIRI|nr:unnamed protein product [Adineta ricciae]